MNRTPFFSIAIPTKNRPDRLHNAIRSVLDQTFQDFEVIVCDNSDDAELAGTAKVVQAIGDPRVRYVRTSGQLSMPDNWERSIADARGEYVSILTDRSVYYPHSLALVHAEIALSGAPVVGWFPDHYGRDASGREFRLRPCSGQRWEMESAWLLDYFLNGHPKRGSKLVPKLLSAVCHRSVLEQIRSSAVGRVCPPVCPDFTSGFLMLAHTQQIVLLDRTLFVSCGVGNGSAFRRRGALADRFRSDLGMAWIDLVDRMPSDACFTHALVLNDLMRLKDTLPRVFAGREINHPQYYLGCLLDYYRAARHGADRAEDYDALIDGLNREPDDVQETVRGWLIYVNAATVLPALGGPPDKEGDLEADEGPTIARPRFDTVFDAMTWAVRQTGHDDSSPAGATPVLPGLEGVKPFAMPRKRRVSVGV